MNVLIQGSNRGIGLELVRRYCARENIKKIIATTRSPSSAPALKEFANENPGKVVIVPLDVTNEPSMAMARSMIRDIVKELHCLINVSGLLHNQEIKPERKLEHIDLKSLHQVFAVNAFGPILMAKYFSDFLQHGERAVFASFSARVGSIDDNRLGGWYAYRSSKAAQNMMTKTLSIELARKAKHVICVGLHPGTVDTELSKPFQGNVPPDKLFSPVRAAEQMIAVLDSLTTKDSGLVFDWQGKVIPS